MINIIIRESICIIDQIIEFVVQILCSQWMQDVIKDMVEALISGILLIKIEEIIKKGAITNQWFTMTNQMIIF